MMYHVSYYKGKKMVKLRGSKVKYDRKGLTLNKIIVVDTELESDRTKIESRKKDKPLFIPSDTILAIAAVFDDEAWELINKEFSK